MLTLFMKQQTSRCLAHHVGAEHDVKFLSVPWQCNGTDLHPHRQELGSDEDTKSTLRVASYR